MKIFPRFSPFLCSVVLGGFTFGLSTSGLGQVTSSTSTVTLNATLAEVLTVSATPATVNFTLAQGSTAAGSTAVAIQTTWLLLPTRANLVLDGYFASSAAALTDGDTTPDNIPASAVLGEVPTGTPTSFTAFTQTTALGPAGAGLTLFTLPLTLANRAGTPYGQPEFGDRPFGPCHSYRLAHTQGHSRYRHRRYNRAAIEGSGYEWEAPGLGLLVSGISLLDCAEFCLLKPAHAQTIQPVIVEYTGKASGRFEVTNDTLAPSAIVLEPKSFSISADGRGVFRPLDAGIHVKLSTTSFKLEPKQSYFVFYKASADTLPAWFTIYAGFSPIQTGEGVKVRVMLPHTVYLYQKKPIEIGSIHVGQVSYLAQSNSVSCDVENDGSSLVRVQEVRAVAGKDTVVAAGFPLLPGSSRHVSIDWTRKTPPDYLLLHFPHFDVKKPLSRDVP